MNEDTELTPLDEARARYEAAKRPAAETVEKERHQAAMNHIGQSQVDRRTLHHHGYPSAAQPTGVRLQSSVSGLMDIMDDGSLRKLYAKVPGVSGRQFVKMRKRAQREMRRVMAPIIALLPVIPNHKHTFAENLAPACGCVYTPEALAKLRAMVGGTVVAQESVNPVDSIG